MAKEKKETGNDQAETTPATVGRVPAMEPWDRWFGDWPGWFGRYWPDRLLGEVGSMLDHIKVEEYVDDGTLVVRAEIPGVDPDEDIDISVDGGRLTIRAERRSEFEEKEEDAGTFRSEFRYGSFSRVVSLPEGADVDEIEASYTDGILTVRVPMAESGPEPKKVSVARG